MTTVVKIAEGFPGADDPDRALLVATYRASDSHAVALETRLAADREAEPEQQEALTKALGVGDPKVEKAARAALEEIERNLRELPPAITVARKHERTARRALAEALLPESEKASIPCALKVNQAAQQFREAAKELDDARRQHVTILQNVGPEHLKNTRPPAAIGFAQPDDLGQRLAAVVLNRDEGWV